MAAPVFLIPTVLYEGLTECLPPYILDVVKRCSVFFVENERTARRSLKLLWKEMVIDDYEWYNMKEITDEIAAQFRLKIKEEKTIGIISEAGCPGVADPGQQLVQIAQQLKVPVKPLVGPNSILLALMGSGMNGQHFQFIGYLPIEAGERIKTIKVLEAESQQKRCTQIFIETPYRNKQLVEAIVKICKPTTLFCVAVNLTAPSEKIETRTIAEWKAAMPDLHKQPAIFCLQAG